MEIPQTDLAPIRELYGKGLYLQAWKHAEALGPVREWTNPAARLLGGRLVIQLGAPRLGHWLHLRAFRDNPTYHEAIYYHARYRFEKHGPLAAWRFMRQHMEWYDAPPQVRADWLGLQGFVAGRLRDFDRAERFLNKADATSPDRPWLSIERASVYEFAERYEDALGCARRSLELVPSFRPGVQAQAHLLQKLGREREAVDTLLAADGTIESGLVVAHLASIQMELGLVADARKSYERYAELSPLMEEDLGKWLAARRCDTAYFLGDMATAAAQAPLAVIEKEPFYADFAKRLEGKPDAKPPTVRLDHGPLREIVRDAKADSHAIELLAAFHGAADEPFEPGRTQALDGLPDAAERRWLEMNGLVAVEARFTPDTAYTLLERGIPFVVTLVDSAYSHTFLVPGADRLRGSIWMIDTSERKSNEAPISSIVDRYGAVGPRLLTAVPRGREADLEGVPFEDREGYDRIDALQTALEAHDRKAAEAELNALQKLGASHRLAILGKLALARYDSSPPRVLAAVDALLALHPTDANFLLAKMNALRELGRREERDELAREQAMRSDGDPLFAQYFAQTALADYRLYDLAVRRLRRSIRKRHQNAGAYFLLANLLWELREHEEAVEMYRLSAALEDRDEQFAEGYWRASRQLDQAPEALRFLQARHNRCKGRLAAPTRSFFHARVEEGEVEAAFEVLDDALQAKPSRPASSPLDPARAAKQDREESGQLHLFAAEMRMNFQQPDKAEPHLAAARAKLGAVDFARVAARLMNQRAELREARKLFEVVLRDEPRDMEAIRNQARLVADLEGRDASIAWMDGHARKLPHYYPLLQLLIEWHRADAVPPGGHDKPLPAETVIRRLIADCTDDAWAHRELALHLASRGRTEAALAELGVAHVIEPDSPSYYYTLGHVHARADRVAEAREAYEEVIRLSIDNDLAIGELVNLARGEEEKKEALEFIAEEIQRQPVVGDGLMAYRDQALQILEPEDIHRTIQFVLDERPEIWQAWSISVQILAMSGRLDEARELAKGAVENFPLTGRLWIDLAEVHEALEDNEAQLHALRKAVDVAPGWGYAARELAEALEGNEQSEDARTVLEQAVARAPADPVNHGYLADHLWNNGEGDEAFERLRFALKLDPGYEWAWRSLTDWAERMEAPEKAIETTRELAALRPGDFRTWLALARMLPGPLHNDEVLDALGRALKLQPRCVEAYDMLAERLAEMGRFDEAKMAAVPGIFDPDPPMVLQGRAAWVEARRGNLPAAIREMSALVALEPHYYWGWQQLAEWHNESGDSQEFLESARKLVEMRPDSPVALAMRGEAKLQTGDREGGKEDLREAQQEAPGYSYAGMLLFDALVQDEEYQAARPALAMLQEHIGGPGQPFVAARYAQLAARTGDKDGGEDALRDVAMLPCDSTWPINTAVAELRDAGWSEMVDRVLRECLETRDDFHPYILLSWIEGPEGQAATPEEKLRMIDRVIAVMPQGFQAYDMKAELLTRLGRFGEALDATTPAVFGDDPPLALRGRGAWVFAARGDMDNAIATMRTILEEDPDYYWGWQQVANWYDQTGNHPEYLNAAEELVRLDPNNPASHAYRGEAKLHGGDRRGAKADFQAAFELDNGYAFAGLHLIDEQISDGELEAATGTLARLQEHNEGPYIRLRALRLAAKRKDANGCRETLRAALLDPQTPLPVIQKMTDSLQQAGMAAEADATLDELVDEPEATPVVGRLWVERKSARGEFDYEERLPALMERGEIGKEAVFAAIESVVRPNQRGRLDRLLERFGPTLERDDRGWAKVALAYEALGDRRAGADWIADWAERQPLSPWMLHPAGLILRGLGRYAEAEELTRKALAIETEDGSVPEFRVWLAFEDALAGRVDEAAAQLRLIDEDEMADGVRIIHAMADALVLVQLTSPDKRSATFEEGKRRVVEIAEQLAPQQRNPDLSRSYQRFVKRLAHDVGGFNAKLWGIGQKFKAPV